MSEFDRATQIRSSYILYVTRKFPLLIAGSLFLFLTLTTKAQVTADFSGSPLSGCSPLVVSFTDLSTGPVTTWFWDFGNGNTSTLQNPAAVYVTPGTYTVTLTVTDGGVQNDTEVKTSYITVFQDPTSNFSASTPVAGCSPLNVCFSDQSTPGDTVINQWLWDFGDGTNSTVQNPCHTFTNPGTYTITLVVTDANGCQSTFLISNYVSVSTVPNAAFTGSPLNACVPPLTVNFTNTSSGGSGGLNYNWTFGDGGTATTTNPSHTYNASGTYTVTLIATDANSCADTLTQVAYVNINTVTAGFTYGPDTVCAGQGINFTDTSLGNPTTWAWNFGDGNTSNAQNPSHTYTAAGDYSVTLIVTNGGSCADTIVVPNAVHVDPSPVANFGADTLTSCTVPFTVTFSDSSSGAVSWAWDFGDGNTSNLQNPVHIYTAPGTYTVSLIVTGANGCEDTLVQNNYIQIVEPVANFNGLPLLGCVPLTVNFTDLSTSNEPIVSWQWDFGDGGIDSVQNPSYTYNATGVYTVTLIIVNSSGCTDTLTQVNYVQVGDPPVACFSATPLIVCVGDPVNFTDCSTNANQWFWQFGDGGTSTAQNPSYAYGDTGCYTVTLTVFNNGCQDDTTITNYICVLPPVAQFNLNPAVGCAVPHTVFFTDQSTLPDTWFWDFGDGNTSTLQNPVHNYTATGSYTVTLTVADTINGCTDDATANVNISIPVADFVGAPLFGCGPLTVNFTDMSTGATAWNWSFGDGGTSTQQNPTYTYNTPGIYTVTLTITDGNGCTDTETKTNYVQVIGPDVNFGADTLGGCRPFTVNFSDSTIFGAPITSWTWDFGDGNNSNLQNPTHTYTSTGNYTVQLTVTDIDGCTRTFTRNNYILVTEPVAHFGVSDSIACLGFSISFSDSSSGVGLAYLWDFGDGNTSTQQNPSHTYAANGNYTVTLTVTDVNGCDSTVADSNVIQIIPVTAGFTAAPTSASCPPLLVNFTDTSLFSINSWTWDFGDGTGSTLQNPSHVYATAGSFDVNLIVTNTQGCIDTLNMPGLINIAGPNGSFVFDPDTGCTPQLVNFNATATNTAVYTWDFGDGNVGITTADSVQHTYTQTGVFHPVLILDDGLGCTFTVIHPDSIEIDTVPFPEFSSNVNLICGTIDTVHFSDSTVSTRPIISWQWDFGDGNTDTVQNPSHLYAAPGSYTVTLTVINQLGCTNTITKPANIVIVDPPIADFGVSDTVGCTPLTVIFSDSSTAPTPIMTWQWNFGDGSPLDFNQNTSHTYTIVSGFNSRLIVIDSFGCADTAFQAIYITPGPTAGFVADDSLGCPPMPVVFTGNTGMGIVSYAWDFGDGNTGTGNPVNHTYAASGTYSVQLIVTDTLGCSDTLIKPNYIIIDPPTADFNANNTSGCPPLNVTFTDNSTSTYPISSYDWDFGDGNTGTGNPVSHTYQNPGTYTVTLIIEDSVGCRDTIVKPNYITVFPTPNAGFFIFDTIGCNPYTIQLQDTSTTSGPAITNWDWDFGDGNTSTLQNPSNGYQNPGNYTIELIVTDINGCRDTTTLPITSPTLPPANFTANDSLGCNPFAITFTADSTDIDSFVWNFGDGNGGTGNPITHSYANNGYYNVTLIVFDIFGCSDTLTKPNYIFLDSVIANFTLDTLAGCPPAVVTFTDLSTSDTTIVSWEWDFGDGSPVSNLQNPIHIYNTPGSYAATLVVTNAIGCTDTITGPAVTVLDLIPPPVPPIYMVTVLNNFSDSLEWARFTDNDFSHYVIYREVPPGSGNFTAIDSLFNINDTSYTDITALNTLINSYCYKIQIVDICGVRSSLDSSETHCTIELDAVGALNSSVLNWNAYVGWDQVDNYEVWRVTSYTPNSGIFLGTVPGTVTNFIDSNVVCYETYYYRVKANEFGGNLRESWSDTAGATPIYVPNNPPIEVVNATVEDDRDVEVNWFNPPQVPVMIINLEKSDDSLTWIPIATFGGAVVQYRDTNVDVHSESYYYRLQYIDSCGDVGPYGNHGRSILLQAELKDHAPFLEWNEYTEWSVGVDHYEIEVYDSSVFQWVHVADVPGMQLEFSDQVTQLDQPIYCYRVRGIEDQGNLSFSLSNVDCVPVGPRLFAPNAFTPNGDGLNDEFFLKGRFIDEYNLRIYNRWGELLFETFTMYDGWDGKLHGKASPEGVYVWVATGLGFDGTEITLRGTVTLLR